MVESLEPFDVPDWRRDAAYDYTETLPRRAWAWEFLRRNPAYQRTWSGVSATVAIEARTPTLTVMTAASDLADMARWGVFFR